MRRVKRFGLHALGLLALLVLAASVATWRNALFPFDMRFTMLVTVGGLAVLYYGWGLVWLVPVGASALVGAVSARLLLWPLTVLAMALLHLHAGPGRGFIPAQDLGPAAMLELYAIPAAIVLLLGSALRGLFSPDTSTVNAVRRPVGRAIS